MKQLVIIAILAFSISKGFTQTTIEAKNIANYVNDSVRVIGKVKNTYISQSAAATILEVEISGANTFDVIIKNEDRAKFDFPSETIFTSKLISVTGKVVLTSGRYKVNISLNQQLIMILGEWGG